MQQSNLQRILAELGITPVYEYNGRTFYDTKEVFDRHNFARDVKRNVEEDEWVLEKTKYYLSERGVVMFAFKKGVTKGRLCSSLLPPPHLPFPSLYRICTEPALSLLPLEGSMGPSWVLISIFNIKQFLEAGCFFWRFLMCPSSFPLSPQIARALLGIILYMNIL